MSKVVKGIGAMFSGPKAPAAISVPDMGAFRNVQSARVAVEKRRKKGDTAAGNIKSQGMYDNRSLGGTS